MNVKTFTDIVFYFIDRNYYGKKFLHIEFSLNEYFVRIMSRLSNGNETAIVIR